MTSNPAILIQLRALHDLTNAEIQVATTRTAQARTEAVKRELGENADNGRKRAEALEAAISERGGRSNILGPLTGRLGSALKTVLEQGQPFHAALLGDLALEHQLLDRARYLKALAVGNDDPDAGALADRLITAHSATVEWLTTLLAEEAVGGPVALRRSPLQAVAGRGMWLLSAPGAAISGGTRLLARAAGRESDSGDDGAVSDFPIDGYEELNVPDAVAAIKDLTQPSDVRAVVAFEESHKNRQGVVSAAQAQLATIAKELISSR